MICNENTRVWITHNTTRVKSVQFLQINVHSNAIKWFICFCNFIWIYRDICCDKYFTFQNLLDIVANNMLLSSFLMFLKKSECKLFLYEEQYLLTGMSVTFSILTITLFFLIIYSFDIFILILTSTTEDSTYFLFTVQFFCLKITTIHFLSKKVIFLYS